MFLRDYVDGLFYRLKSDKRKRKRFHDDSRFATGETTAPQNAPRWTKSGYNGSMRKLIIQKLNEINDPFPFPSFSHDTHHSAKNKMTVSQESASENLDEKEQEENDSATDENNENGKNNG